MVMEVFCIQKIEKNGKYCKNLSKKGKEKEKIKIFDKNSKNMLTKWEICDNIKSSKEKRKHKIPKRIRYEG